jgi:hypothetical protein
MILRLIRPFGRGERPGVEPVPPDRLLLAVFFATLPFAGLVFAAFV